MKLPQWFPFVWRSDHENLLAASWAENARADARILALEGQITTKDEQIIALTALVAHPKSTTREESATPTPKKETKPSFRRGGWRHMAQSRSQSTTPKQNDSIEQLNERIVAQGGIV
jgi:hypothetical protein